MLDYTETVSSAGSTAAVAATGTVTVTIGLQFQSVSLPVPPGTTEQLPLPFPGSVWVETSTTSTGPWTPVGSLYNVAGCGNPSDTLTGAGTVTVTSAGWLRVSWQTIGSATGYFTTAGTAGGTATFQKVGATWDQVVATELPDPGYSWPRSTVAWNANGGCTFGWSPAMATTSGETLQLLSAVWKPSAGAGPGVTATIWFETSPDGFTWTAHGTGPATASNWARIGWSFSANFAGVGEIVCVLGP